MLFVSFERINVQNNAPKMKERKRVGPQWRLVWAVSKRMQRRGRGENEEVRVRKESSCSEESVESQRKRKKWKRGLFKKEKELWGGKESYYLYWPEIRKTEKEVERESERKKKIDMQRYREMKRERKRQGKMRSRTNEKIFKQVTASSLLVLHFSQTHYFGLSLSSFTTFISSPILLVSILIQRQCWRQIKLADNCEKNKWK